MFIRGLGVKCHYTTRCNSATVRVARSSYSTNKIQGFAQLSIISPMHLFVIDPKMTDLDYLYLTKHNMTWVDDSYDFYVNNCIFISI